MYQHLTSYNLAVGSLALGSRASRLPVLRRRCAGLALARCLSSSLALGGVALGPRSGALFPPMGSECLIRARGRDLSHPP